jgi:hypothetical protein
MIKAIPTIYRNTKFRSRLEARWAEFFDMIGVVWEYEPEGYVAADGTCYLPDFWLPHVRSRGALGGVFFEVKPTVPDDSERHKARVLAVGKGRPVLLASSYPQTARVGFSAQPEYLHEFVSIPGADVCEDEGLKFARCDNCGQVDAGVYSSDEPPCQCGRATFNPYNSPLEFARSAFPNFSRWEAAA